ncbi:MAG: M3 family oligoendopeptidase [Lachnospiraceae bacterium]|nr:M3 family oligoendopeptidase [Robinsoniella sp.]MDY3766642.1 M3 family oligoendopeptidase [Lachnospiraceae bacterium]
MKFQDMPYKRVDFNEVRTKFRGLMEEFQNAKSAEEQFEVHKKYYQLINDVETYSTIASIRHDVDTVDEFYRQEKDYYDAEMPAYQDMVIEYQKMLFQSPHRAYLEEKIGPVAFKSMELAFKGFDTKIITLMQEENALTTRYANLIAGAKIEWDGEILNLSLMTPYLRSEDQEIRKRAYERYIAYFESVGEELDQIYDQLVKNRTAQARALGYKNYVELGYYRMNRNSYGQEEVARFRRQVKEDFVPFVKKVQERRRARLGLEKLTHKEEGIYFPQGNPKPVGTPQEILECGQRMYEELSPETKEFMDFMMENELFDVLGRKTKSGGGYMTYLPNYRAPFIFANFNGTSGDVDVITHECGHAFQGYLAGMDPIKEHADVTMETAEIHSMSMEFFTNPWMKNFFGDRSEDFLKMQLEDAIIFIPYGTMVDEFQHIIYENPDMTPKQRHETWRRLEDEYRPYLSYEDSFFDEGKIWQKQLHIYMSPFYYIDYVLAQTCAFQYKIWMDENYEEAWESYLKLCRLSASDFYGNMLKKVGVKVPFEDGIMKEIAEKLEEKLEKMI